MPSQRRHARGLAPRPPSKLRRFKFDLRVGAIVRRSQHALDRTAGGPWDGQTGGDDGLDPHPSRVETPVKNI